MKLMERVIKETLRIFPVGPLILRKATDVIPLSKGCIPVGSTIVVSIINLHRDAAIWKNPSEFDPDRFLPENMRNMHSFAYLPFSGGPRNCIGPKFSMMAMKSILSTILRKYYVRTLYRCVDDIRLGADMMIRATDGYYVKFERRI